MNEFVEETWFEFFVYGGKFVAFGVWRIKDSKPYDILCARRQVRNFCTSLKEALSKNELKLKECQKKIRDMEKEYVALRDFVNIGAKVVVDKKRAEAIQRGLEFKGFTRDDLRQWLDVKDIERVESAERLLTNIEALRTNEKYLSDMSKSLYDGYVKSVNRYNTVDLSEHLNDIKEIISSVKLDGLDKVMDEMSKNMDSFVDKLTDLDNLNREEDREKKATMNRMKPSTRVVTTQNKFLDEVIGLSGVPLVTEQKVMNLV